MGTRLHAALLVGVCCLAIGLRGQETSVAEAAHAASKANSAANPSGKVYDNDNLPTSSTVSTVGNAPAALSDKAKADEREPTTGTTKAPAGTRQSREQRVEEARAAVATQKQKIADLEVELNRLDRDNQVLKAEHESNKSFDAIPICGWGWGLGVTCRPQEPTEREKKYREYVAQRDSKKAELDIEMKQLDIERNRLEEIEKEIRVSQR